MMIKRDLTQSQIELIDPTGKGRAFLSSLKETTQTPSPSFVRALSSSEWLNWLEHLISDLSSQERYLSLLDVEKSSLTKFGPQGGHFSLDKVLSYYESSYSRADRSVQVNHVIRRGRDYLLRLIKYRLELYGYPCYAHDMGITGTSAALPTMLKKGEFLAETISAKPWRHVFHDLPGQRRMRLKDRVINQDSNLNVRYIESYMSSIRKWLKTYIPEYFSQWLNPREIQLPRLSKFMRRPFYSVEGDYDHCDESFSLDIVMEVVLPVYELLSPFGEYVHFASFIEELFYQPVFFGTYELIGKHNLFSGQVPTNDFESIYDVCLALGSLLEANIAVDDSLIMDNGDDVAILVREKSDAERCFAIYTDSTNLAGMNLSLPKCAINKGYVNFCRRQYKLGYPSYIDSYGNSIVIGAYPASLTLNSLINPEKWLPEKEQIVASLSRCDNLYGHPRFHQFVTGFWKRIKPSIKLRFEELDDLYTPDWWDRVYGEAWKSSQSPTIKILRTQRLDSRIFED